MLFERSITFLVDIFYMKTCSFRGAQPRSLVEDLFCQENEPEIKYGMTTCPGTSCSCCFPRYQWDKSQQWSVIDLTTSSFHRFINGYTTYLNCPVVSPILLTEIFSWLIIVVYAYLDLFDEEYNLCNDMSLWQI